MDTTVMLIIFILLCILSAFFSSAETAYTSLNRLKIKFLADEKNRRAQRALLIFDNFDITITTILLCNNVVNIAAASIGTLMVFDFFPELSANAVALVSTIAVTAIILVFGEVLPKNYAKAHAEQFALLISGLLLFIIKVLKPVVWPIRALNHFFAKIYHTDEDVKSVTEDELKAYIDAIEEEGVLEEEEGELVRSVLDFDETTIGEILTPRTDIVGIDVTIDIDELFKILLKEKYSRLPLYDENLDNIIGIIYERDILIKSFKGEKLNLNKMSRPALFVPKSMKASSLLRKLQEESAHMAIVIDEHGGTCGLITMEDLLEEIVGDIWDEHDEVIEKVVEEGEELIVLYDQPITDFFDEYLEDDQYPETEYSSLGGWVYELLEVMPEVGDEVTYHTNKYLLIMKVEEIDNNRIEKLRVKIEELEDEEKELKI